MKGHIRRRASGRWTAVVDVGRDPLTGRRRQKWISGPTRASVEKALRRVLAEVDAGTYQQPARETVAAFLSRWLDTHVRHRVSARTLDAYRDQARHVSRYLGAVRLDRLKPEQIASYSAACLDSGLSPRSAWHYYHLLKRALKTAVRWGLLQRNPAELVDAPRVPRKRRLILDAAQTAALVAAAQVAAQGASYLPILLAVTTAMRMGEILALRWQDVDIEVGALTVSNSLEKSRTHGRRLKAPKTESGHRSISLPPVTVAALVRARGEQAERRLLLGSAWHDLGLVCPGTLGDYLTEETLRRGFYRVRDALGLPKVTFHGLRHSSASLLLSRGMPLPAVSRRLGHSTPAVTAGVYSHALQADDALAAEIAEKALSSG